MLKLPLKVSSKTPSQVLLRCWQISLHVSLEILLNKVDENEVQTPFTTNQESVFESNRMGCNSLHILNAFSKTVLSFPSLHTSPQPSCFLPEIFSAILSENYHCWESFLASTTNTETQARGMILLQSFNFLIWLFPLTKLCLTQFYPILLYI